MSNVCAIIGLVLTGVLFYFGAVHAAVPSVVINEVMWMGSSASSGDEWIELHNTTAASIDLAGWSLTKLSSGSHVPMLTVSSGTIAGGGYFLIANDPAATSRLAVTSDLTDGAVSLVNSKLQVSLYDANGVLIDRADDGVGNPAAGAYTSGAVWKSMERNATGEDGTQASSWHTASASLGFDDALKEVGTPASQNSNAAPVATFVSPDSVPVGSTAQFDASETTDPENDPLLFQWDFGDGTSAVGSTASHAYAAAGTLTIRLTVSDGQASASAEHSISVLYPEEQRTIEPPAAPPASSSSDPQSVAPLQTHIRLSELLPNPAGSDTAAEYIELENFGDEEVDLSGWRISDSASSYTVAAGDVGTTLIAARSFFVLSRSVTGIALNNSGSETVTLFGPDGAAVDSVMYASPIAEGASNSLLAGQWQWTTVLTPGQPNQAAGVSSAPSPAAASSPERQTSSAIFLNEVLPDPAGSDLDGEFIEVVNSGKEQVNLHGWKLTNGATSFVLDRDVVVEPGETVAFSRSATHLALPNAQPTSLFLVDPFGAALSGVRYPRSVAGKSFSRFGTRWVWTAPSPNAANLPADEPEEQKQDVRKTKTAAKPVAHIALAAFASQPRRSRVLLRGTVNAPFGILGANLLSLQEGNAAVMVQIMSAEPLDADAGDVVAVEGVVGQLDGQKKLNVASADDVRVVGHTGAVLPVPLEAGPAVSGILGELVGTVASRRGATVTVKTADREWKVQLKPETNIDPQNIAAGTALTVRGVVRVTSAGLRLYPREENDLIQEQQPSVRAAEYSTSAATSAQNIAVPSGKASSSVFSFGLPLLTGISVAGWLWWKRRKAAV